MIATCRVLVCLVFIVVVLAHDDKKKCGRVIRAGGLRCCLQIPMATQSDSDDAKECNKMPFKPHSCDREECFAKKKGYYSSDGDIDFDALGKILDKDFEDHPTLLASFKETCFTDLSKYGPPGMCDFMKIKYCMHVEMIKNCGKWSDEGECNGVEEIIKECLNEMP